MTTSQAPWVNLVMRTMTRTTAVRQAPKALTARRRRMSWRSAAAAGVASSRLQCLTMPAWERVKETKTPMMYSWMRRVSCASKATIRAMAASARRTMPLE
ncbi:hypothetical protein STANM309S_01434 [Streptomyces tanashiensis]